MGGGERTLETRAQGIERAQPHRPLQRFDRRVRLVSENTKTKPRECHA
jgi:hypothetical protein